MVRLIQTKWNGIVSHDGHAIIAATLTPAKANQPTSTLRLRSQAIPDMANSLDWRHWPELLAKPPDADLDDVRSRVEAIAPDLREQSLPARHFSLALRQVLEQPELAIGKVADDIVQPRLPSRDVEHEPAEDERLPIVVTAQRRTEVDTYPRQQ